MVDEEILDAVEARELSVWVDALCETAAEVRVDLVAETLLGIFYFSSRKR